MRRPIIKNHVLLLALLLFPICGFPQEGASGHADRLRDTLEMTKKQYHEIKRLYEANDSLLRHSCSDSLSALQDRVEGLNTENEKLTGELSKLQGELFELEQEAMQKEAQLGQTFATGILLLQRRYVRNKSTLNESLADINLDTLALMQESLQEFAQLDGYDEYRRDVERTIVLKKLYDEAMGVLTTKYEKGKVSDILKKTSNFENGKLSHEREIESLNTILSWYDYDVFAAKLIIQRVNKEIYVERKKNDSERCSEIIKSILSPEDNYVYGDIEMEDVFTYREFLSEFHLDDIPYLHEKWREYIDELMKSPLQDSNSGEEIMSIDQ